MDAEAPAPVPERRAGAWTGAGSRRQASLTPAPQDEAVVRRFFGVKSLDPQRVSRDADQIADRGREAPRRSRGRGRRVKLEISANVPDGVPDDVVRTVTENAKTLKFEQHGFEES